MDRAQLQAVAAGETTISNKVRALARHGASRREIADLLGRSYQQVRQVLVEDERRQGLRRFPPGPELEPGSTPIVQAQASVQLEGIFRMLLDAEGRLKVPDEVAAAVGVRPGGVVIGRMQDGELVLSGPGTAMRKAQELVRSLIPQDVSLADELVADRRREPDA